MTSPTAKTPGTLVSKMTVDLDCSTISDLDICVSRLSPAVFGFTSCCVEKDIKLELSLIGYNGCLFRHLLISWANAARIEHHSSRCLLRAAMLGPIRGRMFQKRLVTLLATQGIIEMGKFQSRLVHHQDTEAFR